MIIKPMCSRTDPVNIALIGMPGCGKSVIGQAMHQICRMPLIDSDLCIEQCTGLNIPEVFRQLGEGHFRALETEILRGAAQMRGIIIATGGGSVLKEENRLLLKGCARVIWVQRDLSLLSSDGRPLSIDLPEMYRIRAPIYGQLADQVVQNDSTIEDAARIILNSFNTK